VKDLFDGPLKSVQINIFKGMANSPAALGAYLGMAGALKEGMLSEKEREAIALTVAESNACDYCRAAHTALGLKAGHSEADTLDIRRGRPADAKLAALLRFARTLNDNHTVSDADVQAVRAVGYNDGQIAEAVATVALNIYTNLFNLTNQTTVDFPAAPPLK
jgi:uncharacterized peroxidase-related enzyme